MQPHLTGGDTEAHSNSRTQAQALSIRLQNLCSSPASHITSLCQGREVDSGCRSARLAKAGRSSWASGRAKPGMGSWFCFSFRVCQWFCSPPSPLHRWPLNTIAPFQSGFLNPSFMLCVPTHCFSSTLACLFYFLSGTYILWNHTLHLFVLMFILSFQESKRPGTPAWGWGGVDPSIPVSQACLMLMGECSLNAQIDQRE